MSLIPITSLWNLDVHKRYINIVGKDIVSINSDINIHQWYNCLCLIRTVLNVTPYNVSCFKISPNRQIIISWGFDISATDTTLTNDCYKIWDINRKILITTLEYDKFGTGGIFVSYDGKKIYSISSASINVWNYRKKKLLMVLTGHKSQIVNLYLTSDNRSMVSTDVDNNIIIWNTINHKPMITFDGIDPYTCCISFDGRYLVMGSTDNIAILFDLHKLEIIKIFGNANNSGRGIWYLNITSDNKKIIVGINDRIEVWEIDNGFLLVTFNYDKEIKVTIDIISISPDNKIIIAASTNDQLVFIWNLCTGKIINAISTQHKLNSLYISFDSKRMILINYDNIIDIFDINSASLMVTFNEFHNKAHLIGLITNNERIF